MIETITGLVTIGGQEYPVSEQVQLPDPEPGFLSRLFRRSGKEDENA